MNSVAEQSEVILGVDTHLDVHVAVLIDVVGRVVATTSIPTTASGYERLIQWANGFGSLARAGVEGTGDLWRSTCATIAKARHTGARDQPAGSFSAALARQE
jgi:hypothetical protein